MEIPEWPLFVFLDDTTLEICESLDDARRNYEGIDVESGVFSFYDFSGCPVKPVFAKPNRHSSFLGILQSSTSGAFDFRRDSVVNRPPMDRLLQNTTSLSTNDRFSTLDDIKNHLKNCGIRIHHFQVDEKNT